jgi:hypothetical protein
MSIPTRIDRMPRDPRKDAEPFLSPKDAIAAALSTFVPGPADLISPEGRGVRVILLTLQKCGLKIVAMEREDFK